MRTAYHFGLATNFQLPAEQLIIDDTPLPSVDTVRDCACTETNPQHSTLSAKIRSVNSRRVIHYDKGVTSSWQVSPHVNFIDCRPSSMLQHVDAPHVLV